MAERIPIFASWTAAGLAIVLIARGKPSDARPYVERALAEGNPVNGYEARLASVELAFAVGAQDAPRLAADAHAQAERGGHLLSAARLRVLLGEPKKPGAIVAH